MAIDQTRIKRFITDFKLKDLFIEELGWNHPPRSQPLRLSTGTRAYALSLLAEKSGFQVFACTLAPDEPLPDANMRLKLERQLTPLAAEHLLVFLDAARTTQFWQWARREPIAPIKLYKETFTKGSSGERLAQRLALLAFSLAEEARGISVTEVARRTKQAFYAEKVTKSFYAKFKTEHEAFLKQIKGIDDEENRNWYASLMLNRLMFVYFIQRKGFLDGDNNYLKNKLAAVKAELGADKFHSFYRSFLLRLFHEGLGAQPHSPQLVKLIGRVPYLNGGLFEVHKLEEGNAGEIIEIPDKAFKRIFEFFDEYDWHLDSRPLGNEREINPDVLGYIFEQYINNKQMGAYYTKEDITEYISKNTIIPFLFDRAAKDVAIAFKPQESASVWQHLQQNPDRYIYEAVRKGVIDEAGNVIELPAEIAAGVDDIARRAQHGGWNRTADARYGLPTETWREHVARRKRCQELRGKLQDGAIHAVNDLITWNLDIRQFAQDIILQTDSPDLVRAFYRAIAGRMPEKSNEHFEHGLTVLDPTCGSGAVTPKDKAALRARLKKLSDKLDVFLAHEYGVDTSRPLLFEAWRKSHQPFHWYTEFFGIIKSGGFDVVIGNPPYVELSAIRSSYRALNFKTESCGNLYALCLERCVNIQKDKSWLGLVVQQPFVSTQRMQTARDLLSCQAALILSSTYDDRPGKLFNGIHHARIAIVLAQKSGKTETPALFVTGYKKWYKEERAVLFPSLSYTKGSDVRSVDYFPKIGSSVEAGLIKKLLSNTNHFAAWIHSQETEHKIYYKITGVGHWFTITARPPRFLREGKKSSSTREHFICFANRASRDRAFVLLNSSLFYWFYQVRTNCRDFNPSDYKTFPIVASLDAENLSHFSMRLQKALDESSDFISINHSKTGAIQVEQFRPRESKPIIDEIDRVLARHYGFTDEELDFILNYDIKYRMGRDEE